MSSEDMNLSINGQSKVPPGFRFHPTEEELLHYYLKKKVAYERIDLDVIREVDLNKLEPWDIQERCKIGSTPQNDWYFFSHKDKKYPTGTRTNRATTAGFWKATGRDKIIYSSFRRIGLRKTLVFYKGRAPHGEKSDWIMHEYRLDDGSHETTINNGSIPMGEAVQEEGWVVCRVFGKKNYQKTLESSPNKCSSFGSMDSKNTHQIVSPCRGENGVLDQILLYMGRTTTCKMDTDALLNHTNNNALNKMSFMSENSSILDEGLNEGFVHLPRLDSPDSSTLNHTNSVQIADTSPYQHYDEMLDHQRSPISMKWVTLDRLVASQLDGTHISKQVSSCFDDLGDHQGFGRSDPDHDQEIELPQQLRSDQVVSKIQGYIGDDELWSFTKSSYSPSSSDPLRHLSV